MSESHSLIRTNGKAGQALALWGVFIIANIALNGTIPFVLGRDLHQWTYSLLKNVAYNLVIYGGVFLVAPLVLTKGWAVVRRPAFLVPLLIAVVAMTARAFVRPMAALAVIALAYLHWRFDLSELGLRSRDWRGDGIAVLLVGLLAFVPRLLRSTPPSFAPTQAFLAGLDRLFANPASTTENLFYFGFLTDRLSHKMGRWFTPLAIGLLYTAHEMSNPEYWYEGLSFGLVLVGVALMAAIYLWRRSIVVIWLGDGLGRFASALF